MKTRFPEYFEYRVHQVLKDQRVCKYGKTGGTLTLQQGGTEWFVVDTAKVRELLGRVKLMMRLVWLDDA